MDSGLVRHCQAHLCKLFPLDLPRPLNLFPVVIENQKIVVIPNIFRRDLDDLMIERVEQRNLVQLVDLASKSCTAPSERVGCDFFRRARIVLHIYDFIKIWKEKRVLYSGLVEIVYKCLRS